MGLLDDILRAAQIGETTDWEFKSARGGFPASLWSTYSAMANAEGGVVVLGVREAESGAQLDGLSVQQVGHYQKTLWDGLNNRSTVNLNLLEPQQVEVVEVEGVLLLVIRVPRATRAQRPVHLGGNPIGNTYRRRHEGDYRCTDAEVRRMLADADPLSADQRVIVHAGLQDLDKPSLAQYRQRMRAAKGEHPWLALDDRELLERIGGWMRDPLTQAEGLTLAGLLMFGKDLVIRHPAVAPNYWVDYREKLDPGTRWTDRIYPDGTWEANLLQFYSRVWPKLAAGLPVPFRLEGAMRRDVTPAHEALREAFVNALIHADYGGAGGVVVERYPDRFVIEDPGTLLVSLEQYHRGGVSECRNKSLQTMFLMIGGGEHAGSGTDKIRSGWRAGHWRPPGITVQDQPDRVRLILPMVSLIPEATRERLHELFGQELDALAPAELQALATADIEGAVSNARLQELLTEHPADIGRMLARLCERGLLRSDNRRRWTTYRLLGGAVPAVEGSASLFGDSIHTAGDSIHKVGNSIHKQRDSILSVPAEQPPAASEVDAELARLAEPVASRGRAPPEAVRAVLLQLCAGRYLSVEMLARLLGRNPVALRSRFLAPMVRNGLLQLRFPATPNRPDQAYTTASDT